MIALILTFLKIGFLGFGGGYAMLSLIYEDSLKLGLSKAAFADLNALDLLAPGPIAVNSATYVGYLTHGIVGAVLATLAVCTSSFVFSAILIRYEHSFFQKPLVSYFLSYTKIAAVGMILSVALSLIGNSLLLAPNKLLSLTSMILTGFLRFKFKINTPLVLIIVGLLGVCFYLLSFIV